jgi:hypothetical protein
MTTKLSNDQQLVLDFLTLYKENGRYSAKDIHEAVFGRIKSTKRGFIFAKTTNILKALKNKKLVTKLFDGDRHMYQVKL